MALPTTPILSAQQPYRAAKTKMILVEGA